MLDLYDEVSTDEDERADDEYLASCARYGSLIQRALRTLPIPDLDGPAGDQDDSGFIGGPNAARAASTHDGISRGYVNGRPPLGGPAIGSTSAAMSSSPYQQQQQQQQQRSFPGGGTAPPAAPPSASAAARRVFLRGFAPSVTPNDVVACLSTFGPVARFRLLCDPSSGHSLRCASVVFAEAGDAAKALEAAAQSNLYLANVWAPEVALQADADGQLALRTYQMYVHGPFPALLEVPRNARLGPPLPGGGSGSGGGMMIGMTTGGMGGMAPADYRSDPPSRFLPPPQGMSPQQMFGQQRGGVGGGGGGAPLAPPPNAAGGQPPPQPPPQPPMALCVSGLPKVSGLVTLLEVNLAQFGKLHKLTGERDAIPPKPWGGGWGEGGCARHLIRTP